MILEVGNEGNFIVLFAGLIMPTLDQLQERLHGELLIQEAGMDLLLFKLHGQALLDQPIVLELEPSDYAGHVSTTGF